NNAVWGASDRAIDLEGAFEARHAALDQDQRVEVRAQRPVDRIEIEPYTRSGLARSVGRNPERIAVAGKVESAFTLDRAEPRPQLAAEIELLEQQLRPARDIGQKYPAVDDVEPVDRQALELVAERRSRPIQSPGGVEPDGHFSALDPHLARAPFAAHQRAEREFQADAARAQRARVAAPGDLDLTKRQGRGWQQPRLDRAI